jgi:ATP-dependent DNA helicase RecQ
MRSPEQLAKAQLRAMLNQREIELLIVDEAHSVSQWGHGFRPDYLSLAAAIDHLGRPPVLALTATTTADVIDDITTLLRIQNASCPSRATERNVTG